METIQSAKIYKANKVHRCNYCHGAIEKGQQYERSVLKISDVYTWKNHIECQKIASHLNMFDDAGEGLTDESFIECIKEQYNKIMIKTNLELYESQEFKLHTFYEMLDFVIKHHNITP